jgi:CARDB
VLALSVFLATALAVDTQYKTRFITSATLTIHVRDGVYLTIKNFTQDTDAPGQRGLVLVGIVPSTPTPTPTATPTATPVPTPTPTTTDLIATKTDNVGGQDIFPNQWTWNIHVTNGGNTSGSFAFGQVILIDNLPSTNLTYGSPSVINSVNITNANAINCGITGSDLSCLASDVVTINPGGSFDVSFTATPSFTGTYANPRAGGDCSVDPNNVVAESNESNNTCADTVVSNGPNPTPTPIFAAVLAAALLHPVAILPAQVTPTAEFIKPLIIAGPATLTINPVPPATLSITYRKTLQPNQPTPTPTPSTSSSTPTATPTSTLSATSTSSIGIATTSHSIMVATASGPPDDDDDDYYSTPTPTPLPTSAPIATPSITPTPSPTPLPGR